MQLTPTKWNVTAAFYGFVRSIFFPTCLPTGFVCTDYKKSNLICMAFARAVQTIVNSILTVPSQKEVSLVRIPDYLGFFWIVYTLMKIDVHFPNPPKRDLSLYWILPGKKVGIFLKVYTLLYTQPKKMPNCKDFSA